MPDAKTKIRPQQSCHRCRERKVKCDRSIPCHACIIRGLEAECTYLTTAEDRAHISQSEIIDRLRREVAQLREHLNSGPREPDYSKRRSPDQETSKEKSWKQKAPAHTSYDYGNADSHGYVHGPGYLSGAGSASARGTPDTGEDSWRGSSPSSSITTRTNSAVVTSPDSTGSDSGTRSASVSSRSASASVSMPASAYPVGTGYVPQIAELAESPTVDPLAFGNYLEDTTMSNCYTGGMGYAPGDMSGTVLAPIQGTPMEGLLAQDAVLALNQPPLYNTNSTQYLPDDSKPLPYFPTQDTHYAAPVPPPTIAPYGAEYPIANEDDRHHPYHQWGFDAYGNTNPNPNQLPQLHTYTPAQYYSGINAVTDAANTGCTDPNFPLSTPTLVSGASSSHASSGSQDRPSPSTLMNSMPNAWKGQGKQELLEILLRTIESCDEQRLPQVIQVLRASPSPEEAISGICRVLQIGNRAMPMS